MTSGAIPSRQTSTALPSCPYKGLLPYTEQDAAFFFGRDDERELVVANLLAAKLTLLYGASGVGKSSVLGAGVVLDLRRLAQSDMKSDRGAEFLPQALH